MIRFKPAPAFNFEEWVALAERDPEMFEARRRALLAIEIARGGEHAPLAKAMLERMESQLEGKSPEERVRLSQLEMLSSTREMAQRMSELSAQLKQHSDLQAELRKKLDGKE